MIILPINSLRAFKNKASKISNNKILSICNYIRILYKDGVCTLTKTNNYAFVTEEIEAEGASDLEYMILEKDLFAFIDHSSDKFLTIKKTKKELVMVDDKSTAPCTTTEDPFPPLELPGTDIVDLTPLIIKSIKVASKMLGNEDIPTWRSHVFLGKKAIIGCDGYAAFSVPCDIESEIIFRKEVISSLPDSGVVYKQNASYDFFECGHSLYGFIKSEQSFFDMTSGIKIPESESFVVKRQDLLSFNDWVLDIATKPEFGSIDWNYKDGELILKGQDTYSEKPVERKIPSTGGDYFKYLPMQMNKILKAIDEETLICFRGKNNLCITNESKSFISLIQQII